MFSAQAAFTNLYVFGDGISTTTNNTSGLSFYYGQRYSNGRVWIEVLAQRQGLTYDPNKNWSYFYNSSTTMLANVSSFSITTSNANNALFVIWVNCADLWFQAKYGGTSMSSWTSAINQSQTYHYKAVTNLYAKGARTLIMPNAVDVSTIPAFNTSANANFIHFRCLDYNVAFSNTLNRIRVSCPNLTLYTPDFFTLLTNMLAHPANYGLTNALGNGLSIDAVDAVNFGFPSAAINGFGTNFIFWDPQDPTAMVHAWMANTAQQLISPVRISNFTALNGSNRLVMANYPIGQTNGFVDGRTNLVLGNWTTTQNFTNSSTNVTLTIYVPASDPQRFYRLRFPFSWFWP
jgi:phospholipase/lecithinase/hemolysin